MESLLDLKTALQFVENVGVLNGETVMKKEPLIFLKKLILGYKEHVPFQCISILAQREEEKHVPTLQEVVEAVLSMEGGLCYTLNIFMCLLLKTLNFTADVLDGNYSSYGDKHNHVVVLISNLRYEDDNFIIDVGCGFPFQDPIPVDQIPCSRYFAGLEYRYEWLDKNVARLHRSGDLIPDGEKVVMRKEWRQVFHFGLKPVTFDYFRTFMEGIYVAECDFHRVLRAIRFPPPGKVKEETHKAVPIQGKKVDMNNPTAIQGCTSSYLEAEEERIMVAFKNQSLLIGPMDSALKIKVSTTEWASKIIEHFPTIPSTKVEAAVRNMIERSTKISN